MLAYEDIEYRELMAKNKNVLLLNDITCRPAGLTSWIKTVDGNDVVIL